MIVKAMGTRGSVPVSGPTKRKYGGNTTCWRIRSTRVSNDHEIIIDAGSGLIPLTEELPIGDLKSLTILFTHYHHDHVLSLGLCPMMYMKKIQKRVFGPQDNGKGALDAIKYVFQKPYFPVTDEQIKSSFISLTNNGIVSDHILVFYQDLYTTLTISEYEEIIQKAGQIEFIRDGRKLKVNLIDVLICRNMEISHPDKCVSYRFEEYGHNEVTRRIELSSCFVLMTDCEAQSAMPGFYKTFMAGAGLVAVDCQYSLEDYQKYAGFGHGSPDWVGILAANTDTHTVGIIHHDPGSTDDKVDGIVTQCRQAAEKRGVSLRSKKIIGIQDYMEFVL